MKNREVLGRLRDLRQLREQRAREAVARRRQATLKAAEMVRDAAGAIALELQRSATDEEEAFAALSGNLVTANGLHEMQHRFDAAAGRLQALEARQAEARDAECDSRADLSKARDVHRLKRRRLEKLESVIEQEAVRERHRKAARAELFDEEQSGGAGVQRRSQGPWGAGRS
ncbi:hypothetical protein [Nitratireductor sp. ZSWI3]|uniref:hypothetical protein n=1 Tax=Nitratireductor sp. ZSWI3 TaxID=2966359 RepID=UPI00214FE4EA|nr:hypothetical protein [Nitratireductor sp. ZSWI3]MCR4264834.1 hypothetical protein [Nitratireductor sp. ZSWI3]